MRSQRDFSLPTAGTEPAELARIFAAHSRALAAFEQILAAHGRIAALNDRLTAPGEGPRRTPADLRP